MFSDLNIIVDQSEADAKDQFLTAHSYGWKCVAFSHVCHINQVASLKNLPLLEFNLEAPSQPAKTVSAKKALLKQLASSNSPSTKQLHRVTLIIDDVSQQHLLSKNQELLSRYHLIAVQPTSEKAFVAACSTMDIDIISVDLKERLPFYFKITTIHQAVQRGIVFEINYSHLIMESKTRRNFISNVYSLLRSAGAKDIIVSSGATSSIQLRSPHDVANLSILFDINSGKMEEFITKAPEKCLYHAGNSIFSLLHSILSPDSPLFPLCII